MGGWRAFRETSLAVLSGLGILGNGGSECRASGLRMAWAIIVELVAAKMTMVEWSAEPVKYVPKGVPRQTINPVPASSLPQVNSSAQRTIYIGLEKLEEGSVLTHLCAAGSANEACVKEKLLGTDPPTSLCQRSALLTAEHSHSTPPVVLQRYYLYDFEIDTEVTKRSRYYSSRC